jgi:hypothetical protein
MVESNIAPNVIVERLTGGRVPKGGEILLCMEDFPPFTKGEKLDVVDCQPVGGDDSSDRELSVISDTGNATTLTISQDDIDFHFQNMFSK